MDDLVQVPFFELKRKDHCESVADVLKFIYESQVHTDVTLICNQVIFKAHKIMLSLSSPFFKNLFSRHSEENAFLVLDGYSPVVIQQLLHFIYKGFAVSPNAEVIIDIANSAKQLQINGANLSNTHKKANLELLIMDKFNNLHSIPKLASPAPSISEIQANGSDIEIVSSGSDSDEVCLVAEVSGRLYQASASPARKKRKLKQATVGSKTLKVTTPTPQGPSISSSSAKEQTTPPPPTPPSSQSLEKKVTNPKIRKKKKKEAGPREEIYCALCDKKFLRQNTLKKHLLKHFMDAQAATFDPLEPNSAPGIGS